MGANNLAAFLLEQPSPAELAKFLVFGDLTGPESYASLIAVIDDSGGATEVARFGIPSEASWDEPFPVWKSLPQFKAIRSGKPSLISTENFQKAFAMDIQSWSQSEDLKTVLLLPLMKSSGPFGLVLLFYKESQLAMPSFAVDFDLFSSLVNIGVQISTQHSTEPKPDAMMNGLLTDRQSQVMSLVSRGFTNKEIARKLSMTVSTVKHEISSILKILGAESRKKAVELLRESPDILNAKI